VGDTLWQAAGPDLPAGTIVRVTAANATVLQVERLRPPGVASAVGDGRPTPPDPAEKRE
jgi:hypothetical protein